MGAKQTHIKVSERQINRQIDDQEKSDKKIFRQKKTRQKLNRQRDRRTKKERKSVYNTLTTFI